MADDAVGCARVTGTVVDGLVSEDHEPVRSDDSSQEVHVSARVGQQAPDFTAPAYHNGGFNPINLSDYAGKWTLLCFYPGDFTFV